MKTYGEYSTIRAVYDGQGHDVLPNRSLPVADREALVVRLSIEQMSEEDFQRTYHRLSEPDQKKNDRYRFALKKKQHLAGRYLLAACLQLHGHAPQLVKTLRIDEDGRPFLPALPLDFSISHSGQEVLCAMAPQRIGIDIEKVDHTLDLALLMPWMNPQEQQTIIQSERPVLTFYQLWTAKEAVLKAQGIGLATALGTYRNILDFSDDGRKNYRIRNVPVRKGYIARMAIQVH